jgi:chromosome segregation ATPase
MSEWSSWFDKSKLDVITRLRCAVAGVEPTLGELLEEAATYIEKMRTVRADVEGRWADANNGRHRAEKKLDNLIALNDSLRREIRLQRQEIAALREERKIFLTADLGSITPQNELSGDIP